MTRATGSLLVVGPYVYIAFVPVCIGPVFTVALLQSPGIWWDGGTICILTTDCL